MDELAERILTRWARSRVMLFSDYPENRRHPEHTNVTDDKGTLPRGACWKGYSNLAATAA
ncbi:hypothetical protein M8494_08345 [Serratia ureilytica]